MAEITLSHLMRLAIEQSCPMSREQAVAFLNQEGHAYEMWKQMMRAGEEFIAGSLLSTLPVYYPLNSPIVLWPEPASTQPTQLKARENLIKRGVQL